MSIHSQRKSVTLVAAPTKHQQCQATAHLWIVLEGMKDPGALSVGGAAIYEGLRHLDSIAAERKDIV